MESTLYLVDANNPGLKALGSWTGMGLRGNSSSPMVFHCVVEESTRLTKEGGGFQAMMEIVLPWFQVGCAAVSLGVAKAAERGGRGGGFVFCDSRCLSHGSGHHIQEPKTENLLRMGSIQADCGNAGNQP